ncbi:transcriptional regulatory protein DegU [bacterium BMS3Abin03]|nr:transcriptional regulatory protein DegU [bacterium BMS3Abin03]
MKENSPVKIRVAIIEDNRFILDGLKLVLDAEQSIELIGSYPSCEDAFYYDDLGNAELVLMDINLPGISGIEGVKYIKKHLPAIKVIICTAYEDDENVFNAIAAGAVGFLSKKASPTELIKTIKMVNNGGSPITPNVAVKIISFFNKQEIKQNGVALTETEKKVLEKISLGKSYKNTADELSLTDKEVLTHMRNVYEKMQKNINNLIVK